MSDLPGHCMLCGRTRLKHWIGWVKYPWTGEAHTWRSKGWLARSLAGFLLRWFQ
jgi:hypothetical protein